MKVKDIDQATYLDLFEKRLADTLKGNSIIDEGMRYAMLDGGKRVRPMLVYLGALSVGGNVDVDEVLTIATALECVHGYSLIHDDLPCMDNDDFRRGKPSVHKAFGEANAVLIGDQLLSEAMQLLVEGNARYHGAFGYASEFITKAAKDMVYGQALEMKGCHKVSEYIKMYEMKTGALIFGGMMAGAVLAGADEMNIEGVYTYSKSLGLAFQLVDDLIDIGQEDSLASLIGEEETRRLLSIRVDKIKQSVKKLQASDTLIEYADMLLSRAK